MRGGGRQSAKRYLEQHGTPSPHCATTGLKHICFACFPLVDRLKQTFRTSLQGEQPNPINWLHPSRTKAHTILNFTPYHKPMLNFVLPRHASVGWDVRHLVGAQEDRAHMNGTRALSCALQICIHPRNTLQHPLCSDPHSRIAAHVSRLAPLYCSDKRIPSRTSIYSIDAVCSATDPKLAVNLLVYLESIHHDEGVSTKDSSARRPSRGPAQQ